MMIVSIICSIALTSKGSQVKFENVAYTTALSYSPHILFAYYEGGEKWYEENVHKIRFSRSK